MTLPPQLLRELPGVETAFDETAMRVHLQDALFGGSASRWTLERCEPDRPLLLPGEGLSLQYDCRVRDAADGELLDPIVIGRVFQDSASRARYLAGKLAPLAERLRSRPDLATFARPVAAIEPLHMLAYVWPLDGELPALIDATDPRHMAAVLGRVLGPRFRIGSCRVERVSYRRRSRCVLRYTLTGQAAGSAAPRPLVVYGKLTPRGDQALYGDTLVKLRAHFERRRDGERITIPRSLGWRPELGLALLEAVAGEAKLGTALRARLKAKPDRDGATLEKMLSGCARVAAALHGSGLALGRARSLDDRLADLGTELEAARVFAPEFAERVAGWLERVATHARATAPLPHRLCHGDFKYAQVFFDGDGVGLVDLDNVCQAEPALDLGTFLAYLRTQVRKTERDASVPATFEHDLCEQFFADYAAAMALGVEDVQALRARAALHEVVSLVRVALHSQLKLKLTRLDGASELIEERLGGLA